MNLILFLFKHRNKFVDLFHQKKTLLFPTTKIMFHTQPPTEPSQPTNPPTEAPYPTNHPGVSLNIHPYIKYNRGTISNQSPSSPVKYSCIYHSPLNIILYSRHLHQHRWMQHSGKYLYDDLILWRIRQIFIWCFNTHQANTHSMMSKYFYLSGKYPYGD